MCPAANIKFNAKIELAILKQLTTTYTETRNSITDKVHNKQRKLLQRIKVESFKFSQILHEQQS